MESNPRMEARPPALIESAVRLFVPPIAREHVLGDLSERYTSTPHYLLEATQTIPFVIGSQIRRTSHFPMWPIVALMLHTGFGAGSDRWWPHAVIPSVATLIAFMFRDAYRVPDVRHPWRQGLVDLALVASVVIATEIVVALIRPEWLIAADGVAGGSAILAMLYVLRVQNPDTASRPGSLVQG
jgi:hypothetical protein